jgi:hypothetical protein
MLTLMGRDGKSIIKGGVRHLKVISNKPGLMKKNPVCLKKKKGDFDEERYIENTRNKE